MRIAHVSLRYPPASGGVEDYVQNLVERLRADGDDVTVVTTALRTHHPATLLTGPLNDPPYVRRRPVRTLGPIAYPIPVSLASALSLPPAPALIHAHGFWYAPADIARRVARKRRIPFVLNPYYAPRSKAFWRAYRTLVGRRTLAAADAVVVISPQEERALRADGFTPRRTELIPPGIDPAEFAHRRPNPFVARGFGHKRVLFFAGRIARAKGIDLLLRAFAVILSDAKNLDGGMHLAIAGEDFGERAAFERLADQLGITRAVTWLGNLLREELIAAYQHAAVFVFPSRYEAFGIAALEAQAAGRPVVATNATALPFVVRNGETGLLFTPEEPDDLAHAVLRVLKDPSLANRLGTAARERAHREFPWNRSITKLRALYTELARTAQARPPGTTRRQ